MHLFYERYMAINRWCAVGCMCMRLTQENECLIVAGWDEQEGG